MGDIMIWTKEDIKILEKEYKKRDGKKNGTILKDLALKLNRSENSIRNKAYQLGITKKDKFYSKEEIELLKKYYDKYSMNDFAEILKRNESNIYRKMKELGLKKTHRVHNTINPKKQHIYTNEERKRLSENAKKMIKEKGHPRGFKGHYHTLEEKAKISVSSKNWWKQVDLSTLEKRNLKQRETRIKNGTLNPMINQSNPYSRTKSGKRKDLNNVFFRSAWEANIARYYNFIGVKWEFEPKTFIFHNITRGSVSYTPDFYLPEEDKWVEVKGWMDGKSKTKLKRFKQQYPDEYNKLQLITEKEYNEIKRKVSNYIKSWE